MNFQLMSILTVFLCFSFITLTSHQILLLTVFSYSKYKKIKNKKSRNDLKHKGQPSKHVICVLSRHLFLADMNHHYSMQKWACCMSSLCQKTNNPTAGIQQPIGDYCAQGCAGIVLMNITNILRYHRTTIRFPGLSASILQTKLAVAR